MGERLTRTVGESVVNETQIEKSRSYKSDEACVLLLFFFANKKLFYCYFVFNLDLDDFYTTYLLDHIQGR